MTLLVLLTACGGGGETTSAPVAPPGSTVTSITLSGTNLTFSAIGATQTLTATVRDQNGAAMPSASVAWTSTAAGVASVSATGVVTAVAQGTASITAQSGAVTATATVTVALPAPTVVTVGISPATASLTVGATQQLTATPRDAGGNALTASVTWASTVPGVATVSSAGVVTAVAPGTASITAQAGAVTATATVTVSPPAATVATVVISPTTTTLSVGTTHQFTATARDAGGNPITGASVTWSIASSAVATVSQSGLVTGVAVGSATITALAQGVTGSATVVVQPATGGTVSFAEYLMDPAMVKVITQIGVIGGANTELVGRSYMFVIDGVEGVPIPLFAPTAMTVTAAHHYRPRGAPVTGYVPDWSLLLNVGGGVTLELYHVKDVAASIKAVADTTITESSAWVTLATPVPFAAGAQFAAYQRGLNSYAVDVIAHRAGTVNQFANQQRYVTANSNLLDIVCPWELFAPARRTAYLAAIGSQTGVRVANAGCGSVMRDVAGTLAGQWFQSQTIQSQMPNTKTGFYGDPLPIVLGIDSTVYIGHTGPTDDIRIARSNATWKDPATITTSWCYQILGPQNEPASGWLWLRMNSATQMDAAYSTTGSCPATFPTTGVMPYYR